MRFWLAVNSCGIVITLVIQYLLVRQVAVMLVRLGPSRARPLDQGPRIGENLLPWVETLYRGQRPTRSALYIIASKQCSICGAVRHGASAIADKWKKISDIIFIYDDDMESNPQNAKPASIDVFHDKMIMESLRIKVVPYGIMTTRDGIVVAHGLVNNVSEVESLLDTVGA